MILFSALDSACIVLYMWFLWLTINTALTIYKQWRLHMPYGKQYFTTFMVYS